MADKKAFVFDTNFILQNPDLDKVVENLKDEYTVYITQVSIDERIAQQCRELKEQFDEIERCQTKYSKLAMITFKTTYEKQAQAYKRALQKKYEKLFGSNIIPFDKSAEVFEEILERVNRKDPPFSNKGGASDKGFKDCLLWLSLLKYFENAGEEEIEFLTDDTGAFKNRPEFLIKEFKDITGKTIAFHPNAFYKEKIQTQKQKVVPIKEELPLPDVSQLRDRIDSVLDKLCYVESYDYWGNECLEKTFITAQKFDAEYMKAVFNDLDNVIAKHIFDKEVTGTQVFELDFRISDGDVRIPIEAVENANKLHKEIKNNYPNYIQQFYSTAANKLNSNYVEPSFVYKNDDLPF